LLSQLVFLIEKEEDLTYNSSSLFQGALMEYIDRAYGDFLHISMPKPYSQYLRFGKGETRWVVSTLDDEAKNNILDIIRNRNEGNIDIRHKDLTVKITEESCSSMTYDELMKQTFFAQCPRFIHLRFLSPTAFKSGGSYVFYPTVRYIFQNLIKKFDSVCADIQIGTQNVLEDFENNIEIVKYNLKSTYFCLKGIKIPSFIGELTLKINGPQQLVNLAHLLLRFGTYSGVGIKTAIGMGGYEIIER